MRAKKALVVDDDPVNRKLLQAILTKEGYTVVAAENGQEAVQMFIAEPSDIVLMDIMMPVMNGYQAARQIKDVSTDKFTPIIFLTAITDEEALSKCVESGGDDFLTKPYNRIILRAKISALERIRSLYETLNQQKDELELYRLNIKHELEFAEHVFRNITARGSLSLPYLRVWSSAMTMFNGDLLLSARKPSGGIHLILCDFTGHGLPAAVGALPVSEIFVAMTERGFSINEIAMEMNKKLKNELPTGFFCAACLVDIDAAQSVLRVWNGGLPPVLLVDKVGQVIRKIPSTHLPLGIVDNSMMSGETVVIEVTEGFRLYLCTDGLIEAVNPQGEKFSFSRLENELNQTSDISRFFEHIKNEVQSFRQNVEQHDDISLVELDCFQATREMPPEDGGRRTRTVAAEWNLSFHLSAGIIKTINPVPVIVNLLNQFRVPDDHRRRMYTVLSELYSNAVDHGLLDLESSMKKTPDGFTAYYTTRDERLKELSHAWVLIDIKQIAVDHGYALKLRVEDSGSGFDYQAYQPLNGESYRLSGRGIRLIKTLCDEFVFHEPGNCAEAIYYLDNGSWNI